MVLGSFEGRYSDVVGCSVIMIHDIVRSSYDFEVMRVLLLKQFMKGQQITALTQTAASRAKKIVFVLVLE